MSQQCHRRPRVGQTAAPRQERQKILVGSKKLHHLEISTAMLGVKGSAFSTKHRHLRLGQDGVPASVDVEPIVFRCVDDLVGVASLHGVGLDDDHCRQPAAQASASTTSHHVCGEEEGAMAKTVAIVTHSRVGDLPKPYSRVRSILGSAAPAGTPELQTRTTSSDSGTP